VLRECCNTRPLKQFDVNGGQFCFQTLENFAVEIELVEEFVTTVFSFGCGRIPFPGCEELRAIGSDVMLTFLNLVHEQCGRGQ